MPEKKKTSTQTKLNKKEKHKIKIQYPKEYLTMDTHTIIITQ